MTLSYTIFILGCKRFKLVRRRLFLPFSLYLSLYIYMYFLLCYYFLIFLFWEYNHDYSQKTLRYFDIFIIFWFWPLGILISKIFRCLLKWHALFKFSFYFIFSPKILDPATINANALIYKRNLLQKFWKRLFG